MEVPGEMDDRLTAALVGLAVLAVSLWALVELAGWVTFGDVGLFALLGMLVPATLAIGFAMLVWLRW
ncbi:hypothetical protein [Halobellus litoreus]|uniref:Uncharacterized protein n=1 Tax=Halobellus litoreus TaxID=755310 RepID=A0ABD6DUQ7_9EURY|nr:hypothetical protein [Halobellus litoreus]